MIRVKTLFSAVSVSLFISACSNGGASAKKSAPPQPVRAPVPANARMMNPGLQGPVDQSLLTNSQTTGGDVQSTTVRAQSTDSQPTAGAVPVAPVPLDEFGNPIAQPQIQAAPSVPVGDINTSPITTTAPNNIPYYDPNYEMQQAAQASAAPIPAQVAPAPQVAADSDLAPQQAEIPPAPQAPPDTQQNSAQQVQQPTSSATPDGQFPAGPSDDPSSQQVAAAPVAPAGSTQIPAGLAQAPLLSSVVAFTPTQTNNPDWAPGLARDPYDKPILTYGHLPDGVVFTDGKFDSLMKGAWDILNSDPDSLKTNIDFALQINNVVLSEANGGWFTLTLDIQEDAGKPAVQVVLQGNRIKDRLKKDKRKFGLKEIKIVKGDSQFKYHAHVLCADIDEKSCQSAQIELAKIDKKASGIVQPLAKAIIIHRISDAALYITVTNSKNANHKAFARLIDDTKWNICRNELQTVKGDWLSTLKDRCGKAKKVAKKSKKGKKARKVAVENTGAQKILIRTWAVAGGGAKYEIILDGKSKDLYHQDALLISGDLVSLKDPDTGNVIKSSEPAKVVDRAKKGRDKWIQSVELVNNDGGGDLNFRVTFNATDKASPDDARFSVSSNLKPTINPPELKKKKAVGAETKEITTPAAPTKDNSAPVAPDPKAPQTTESSAPIST